MSVLEDRARAEAEAALAAESLEQMATFAEEGEEEDEEEEESEGIAVTFTEAGSLGLKFTPNKATGAVEVLGINPGTQATTHPQIKPGLTLMAVGATSVVGMPYKQVIETIKAQGRPVTCQFSSTAASPAQSPVAAAPAPDFIMLAQVRGPGSLAAADSASPAPASSSMTTSAVISEASTAGTSTAACSGDFHCCSAGAADGGLLSCSGFHSLMGSSTSMAAPTVLLSGS